MQTANAFTVIGFFKMSSVRQRKLIEETGAAWDAHSSSPKQPSSRQRKANWPKRFFIFVACVAVVTLILGSYTNVLPWNIPGHATNVLDNIAYSLGIQKHVYAVIIDAGSTGSRVLAFAFHESVIDKNLKLDDELFVQVKPGLSSFADNPVKGAESLQELLDRAKAFVPREEWGHTPLAMKATAGLRLLPGDKANALLDEVRKLFDASPFLTNENSVAIMDGVDEGLFSWFTVNFLMDRLGGSGGDGTVAALDLGGGSTQITFAPTDHTTLKEARSELLHKVSAFRQSLSVYTNSYLGLGLMAARKGVLLQGNKSDVKEIHSDCVNPIISGKEWTFSGSTYLVSGPPPDRAVYQEIKGGANKVGEKKPIVDWKRCSQLVRAYVAGKVEKPQPVELNRKDRTINAFSYYFDRATEFGLIDPFSGGVVTVKQFEDAAKKSCETPNAEQPFMCLDLTFITVLLQDGFGLKPEKSLNLYKKIDGHEISWALGAAFHILQNGL
ncbi:ectonucleoside triphosphate diphosphohydrolase 5 isoform X1 [Schistocerca gregaria]|uniref:ectonucleoside triphosphate diphosphohydrolase 5 isoform X1 n=1 Tax=Schistocerca gregaria TaxID=7010 RepID=UPI00211E7571|nr:ectonucleoside triphosphate diphosphohydrolase 5 isoform X1 [Schistocerca gregaria]